MRKRGAWIKRNSKRPFTGNLHLHEVGRKTECRVMACDSQMLKGETHFAAEVKGHSPTMAPGICERPEYFGSNPYVLICKSCGEKRQQDKNYWRWLRRK